MIKLNYRVGCVLLSLGLLLSFIGGVAVAETLNPEGINPHAAAPRKKITQAQKKAAAEARKKKLVEIEARKAGQGVRHGETTNQGNDPFNRNK